MEPPHQAQPAAEGESGDPDRGAAAGRHGAAGPVQCVVDLRQPCACADPRVPVGLGGDASKRLRSRTRPVVDDRPAKQWPPPRGTTCVPLCRAKASVRVTSRIEAHLTTAIGRTS